MNCNSCEKINPLPACLTGYGTMELSNITFPDYAGEELLLTVTDTATGKSTYFEFTEGTAIDITDLYPLMQHYYKFEFSKAGVPVEFLITNPDGTFAEGCCMEFIPAEHLEWAGAEYEVSTTSCTNSASNVSNTMVSITGILNQTGTDAPEMTIQYNSIGDGRVTTQRNDAGEYEFLLDGGANWEVAKSWYYVGSDGHAEQDSMDMYFGNSGAITNLYLDTWSFVSGVREDGLLSNVPFEIRIYP